MLHPLKSSRSTAVVLGVIRELTGDTTYTAFVGTISATINGELKIDAERIDVQLTNSRPNYALIDIMWEDCGYKNYQDMGLFGRMSTRYQEAEKVGPRTFSVLGTSYQIDVTY